MKNWKTLLLGIAMIANTSFAAPQVVDKVAAVVNNGVVLESDVDGLMQSVKLNAAQARQQLPDDATLRHQIMERLIMDQIILQMGQKMGLLLVRIRQSCIPRYTPFMLYPAPSYMPIRVSFFLVQGVGVGVPFVIISSHLLRKSCNVVILGSQGSTSCGYMGMGSCS